MPRLPPPRNTPPSRIYGNPPSKVRDNTTYYDRLDHLKVMKGSQATVILRFFCPQVHIIFQTKNHQGPGTKKNITKARSAYPKANFTSLHLTEISKAN